MFFEMAVQLSDRFPSLDPIKIRYTPAHEIYLLYGRTIAYNRRHEAEHQQTAVKYTGTERQDSRIIRRKAGDDWF